MDSTASSPGVPLPRGLPVILSAIVLLWLLAVSWGAISGALSSLYPPLIAVLVALGIGLPSIAYFGSPTLQALARHIGLARLTAMHMWRVPAALAFYAYGWMGELPPLFWILAGTGDLIAGIYAAGSLRKTATTAYFRRFHIFGFADFVLAVGTGLTYTLMLDPRMAPIAQWPMALIPLFGVGLSGASHLIAFHLLKNSRPNLSEEIPGESRARN